MTGPGFGQGLAPGVESVYRGTMSAFTKKAKRAIARALPGFLYQPVRYIYNHLVSIRLVFALPRVKGLSFWGRLRFARRIARISQDILCPHSQGQIISFLSAFMSLPPERTGCIVEAGAYKGGSTAKFSIGAKLVDRKLVVFDSFEGLPDNQEDHDKSILGHSIKNAFEAGKFRGALEEVKSNITRYGEIDVCSFVEGWFDDTMPGFSQDVCAVYVDVDLASSTRTCIKHLYPLLIPGGVLVSQDGDFPLVIEVFDDDEFWEKEVGCPKPHVEGLGTHKLLKIVKPVETAASGPA